MRRLATALAAVPFLIAACAGGPAAFDARERLPSCGRVELAPAGAREAQKLAPVRCLLLAQARGRRAELVVVSRTIEGEPIRSYYRILAPGRIEVWHDSTGNRFGGGGWSHALCSRVRPAWGDVAAFGCTQLTLHERLEEGAGTAAEGVPTADVSGRQGQLLVLELASGELRRVGAAERSYASPTWSPEGNRLAASAYDGEVASVELLALSDGSRRTLLRTPAYAPAAVVWSPRGERIAAISAQEGRRGERVSLQIASTDGARPETLARYDAPYAGDFGPAWAPDGHRLAYIRGFDTRLSPAQRGGVRVALGRLDAVTVVPGKPLRVLARTAADEWDPRWSPHGDELLVQQRSGSGRAALVALARRGKRARVLVSDLLDARASWSPDGTRVAFVGVTGKGDRRYHLYVVRRTGGALGILAHDVESIARPAWSPDGRTIAFVHADGSVRAISRDGREQRMLAQIVAETGHGVEVRDLAWSPDGRRLAFVVRSFPRD